MNRIKIPTYGQDLALSNKYLKVFIKSLEAKILNEKIEVWFAFFFIL